MINVKEHITEEQKLFCEYWLRYHTTLYSQLTNPVFGLDSLRKMIVYEANTRKRPVVINRLLGRYYKLYKQYEFNRIATWMEVYHDTGEGYRAVSAFKGAGLRWPSD